jgi:hypothetical protein
VVTTDLEEAKASLSIATRPRDVLVPGPTRVAGRALTLVPSTPLHLVASSLVAYGATFGLLNSSLSPMVKDVGVWIGMTIAFSPLLRTAWLRWRFRRAIDRASAPNLQQAHRGGRIRISGWAQARSGTFATPLNRQALVARYLGTIASLKRPHNGRVRWELHALDFVVRMDDGTDVLVRAEDLVLLPHPPSLPKDLFEGRPVLSEALQTEKRPYGWVYREEVIAPGDRVDVLGVIDHVIDPSGSVGSDRQPRLIPLLTSAPRAPVCVRVVLPPEPPIRIG